MKKYLIGLVLLFVSCAATKSSDGDCYHHDPLFCWEGKVEVCETTEEGCNVCTCVSLEKKREIERAR
jgi:hypothetical protein